MTIRRAVQSAGGRSVAAPRDIRKAGTIVTSRSQSGSGRASEPPPNAPHSGPLLLVYAHPDDETFGAAGTMTAATARSIEVTLICATRGEAGRSGIAALDTPELLGAVREQELRRAMAAVGVRDVRFLDYRDSGMAGWPDNDHPRALCQASETEVADKLVVQIRALQPATITTFGPDGLYGHPDHLFVHRTATTAVRLAGDPTYRPELGEAWRACAFYYSTASRERLLEFAELPNSPFQWMEPAQRARLGTPRAEITTVIDIAPYREHKQRAIAAHVTQFGEGGPLADIPTEQREAALGREHFVRVALPWDKAGALPEDFLSALAAATPIAPA